MLTTIPGFFVSCHALVQQIKEETFRLIFHQFYSTLYKRPCRYNIGNTNRLLQDLHFCHVISFASCYENQIKSLYLKLIFSQCNCITEHKNTFFNLYFFCKCVGFPWLDNKPSICDDIFHHFSPRERQNGCLATDYRKMGTYVWI